MEITQNNLSSNGQAGTIKEPELVSAKRLAEMFDVKVTTIWEWVSQSRNNPSGNGIPFIQIPGSRILRFPLKKVREWYGRGRSSTA